MIKLIDNKRRLDLQEGRDYQMGFAFCKKVDENTFETVQPISPCKDYLNDVVYSEKTGNIVEVFGLNVSKNNIFNEDYGYLAVEIVKSYRDLKSNGYENYKEYNSDRERLKSNINHVCTLINHVEAQFGLDHYTTIIELDNQYLFKVPVFWTKYVYLISLYSLLIRLAQYYDGTISVEDFLKNYDKPLDKTRWEGAKGAYEFLANTHKWVEEPVFTGYYHVHNFGICSLVNPETGKIFASKW
jgi:hypothetical protein